MARKHSTVKHQQFLEQALAHLATVIQDLTPQAQMEITFEQYEDEDAHIYVHLPATMTAEDIEQFELTVGAHCNELLLDTGLFIVSAVSR